MKSLRFVGNSKVEVVEVPMPALTPDQVLIRIKVSALCGSEMGAFYSPNASAGNPGHEFAGEIVDTNGHREFAQGDRVGVHVIVGCGTCAHCKTGVLIAGDAMGVAYHLSRRVGVQAHDTVAVFGCGPVGLGVVLLWSFLGGRVIGVDPSEYRRALAENLGAWKSVAAGRESTIADLRALTGGAGPDTCLECAGKPGPVAAAFEAARKGGKVGIVGEQGEAAFNPSRDLIHKELTVYGAWYFRLSEFPGMVELCNRGLKPGDVVTHHFPLEEAQKGYDLMAQQRCGKVLFVQY